MHVNFIRLSLTKSVHLKKIATRIVFLRFIYAIVCLTMNVMIKKSKIKAMFDNDTEISYILKKLTNAAQLSVHQNINIIMINAIDKQVCFFNVCEAVLISIESLIVSILAFVVKRSDYKLFLGAFFNALFA